jgi:hypothetical protein
MTEFLNSQMRETEVLLIEIKLFKSDDGQRALVPRLIGQTTLNPPPVTTIPINEETFLQQCRSDVRPFFQEMLRDAEEHGYTVYWGKVGLSVRVRHPETGSLKTFAYAYPPKDFQLYFDKDGPFTGQGLDHLREELLSLGLLRASGERTLRAELNPGDLPLARRTWALILERMDGIRASTKH